MVVAFCSFWELLEGNQNNFSEILGLLSSVMYVVGQLWHYSESILFQRFEYIPKYLYISCNLVSLISPSSGFGIKNFVQTMLKFIQW